MMTIEQALAATPGGFKLVTFMGKMSVAGYEDRNGNGIIQFNSTGFYSVHNGEVSPTFNTINEACTWLEKKKKWWGK